MYIVLQQHIICGIDIGNFAVKVVVGTSHADSAQPQFLAATASFSRGLRKGTVVDPEEVIQNIRSALQKAQALVGSPIESAYISVNGTHIGSLVSHGVIVASRPDAEITQADIDRLIDAASTVSMSANREIIHRVPKNFIIDGHEFVKSALGMKGVRIEADVLLIQGMAQYLHSLAQCVQACGVDVSGLVYSPFALSQAVLDRHMREHGVISLDLGETFSTMSIFHEGDLAHAVTFPIGSRHLTYDLAVALRIPMDRAEVLKCRSGSLQDFPPAETLDISELTGEDGFVVPKRQISKILGARVDELFDKVSDELKRVSFPHPLPCGIVLSGGGSKLNGILPYIRTRLNTSAHLGFAGAAPEDKNNPLHDPAFAVATGLVLYGLNHGNAEPQGRMSRGWTKNAVRWLKHFMP